MIKIENAEVVGWEHAIRGMRNPMNSWDKSDSGVCGGENHIGCLNCSSGGSRIDCEQKMMMDIQYGYGIKPCGKENFNGEYKVGHNDLDLMTRLSKAGTDHRKFMRMITVYADITAPLYWWKEYDTYKVGTVANSCSTMHKIHEKEFTLDDFSHEHLSSESIEVENDTEGGFDYCNPTDSLRLTIWNLNIYRRQYNIAEEKLKRNDLTDAERKHITSQKKFYWWQMIQLLPSSYNQKRTVMLNYEVLHNMYHSRKNHKLDEWHTFCDFIETLPYAKELIINE